MYQRYAEHRGWKFELLDMTETGLGGMKKLSRGLETRFARLKFERCTSGSSGFPKPKRRDGSIRLPQLLPFCRREAEGRIFKSDPTFAWIRAQGAIDHVNKTDSAVPHPAHIPTGIVVQCQEEKSQHKNRAKSMAMLWLNFYDVERTRREMNATTDRKRQVGSGIARSERVNLLSAGRVTDHRIELTLINLRKC